MRQPTLRCKNNWPLSRITQPGCNDVLFGRGGASNNHKGNIRFRKLVSQYKKRYFNATKANKPKVARAVVKVWRSQNPPGRFLIRSPFKSYTAWNEVGNKKAQEKTSQCLREKHATDKQNFCKDVEDDFSQSFIPKLIALSSNNCRNSHCGKPAILGTSAPIEKNPSVQQQTFPQKEFDVSLRTMQETNLELQRIFEELLQTNLPKVKYEANLQFFHSLKEKQVHLMKQLYPNSFYELSY